MLKKNGGITLIALVVTIIVLLILAGITIAMLTGNNGIITRTNDSKMSQIEGQVQEEIKLAMQSAKIYATQKAVETTGGGWFASDHIVDTSATVKDGILTVLKEDLTWDSEKGNGYRTVDGSNAASGNTTTISITYTSKDYKAATNYESATITGTITVTSNKFELTSLVAHRKASGEGSTKTIIK